MAKDARPAEMPNPVAQQSAMDAAARVEIEQRLLGWALGGAQGSFGLLVEMFALAHTFEPPHDRIADAIRKTFEDGLDISSATIAARMADDRGLAEIGGREYLFKMAHAAPAVTDPARGAAAFTSALRTHRVSVARQRGANLLSEAGRALAAGNPDAPLMIADAQAIMRDALPQGRAHRIQIVPFNEIRMGTKRRDLVKGVIPRVGLAIVWGPPKSGKSFWTFDVVMHVALGREYRGRRVHPGPVVYCAFEGQTGIEARVEAFRKRFLPVHQSPVPFFLEPVTLDLVADHVALIAAIRHQLGDTPPVAVVLDTLNRSLRGSESSDEDMSAYVRAADAVREAFECAVVIVHHCGIDGSRPRGHTSLTGAADVQISVKRDGEDNITAEIECSKDGPQGGQIVSRLEVVEVGEDEDGEIITSCVIVPSEASPAAKNGATSASLNTRQRGWLKDLQALFAEPDAVQMIAPASGMAQQAILTREQVREGIKRKGRFTLNPDGNLTGSDREKLRAALTDLKDKGKLCMTDRYVWLLQERQ